MPSQSSVTKSRVLIDTFKEGVLDVSDDVMRVSHTANLDGVSTCSLSLNNYSNNLQGRYNSLLKIGDRFHLDLYDGGVQFPRFTGYLFSAPQYAYNANSFDITAHDLIGAMQWKLWNPYAEASYKRYVAPFAQIASGAQELGITDSGIGNVMLDFLMTVCGMSKNMIYIQKFPDLNNVMKNILKATVCKGSKGWESEFEAVFEQLFGTFNPSTISGSSNGSGDNDTASATSKNALWQKWLKTYPIGGGEYATGNNTNPSLTEQCWSLFESYTHLLFNWPWQGGPNYQPAGGNGAYWQEAKDGTCDPTVLADFQVLDASAKAEMGDVVFWSATPGRLGVQYGHVAVVFQDLGSSLKVENQWVGHPVQFDTFPKNSDGYKIAGYLRPKIFAGKNLASSTTISGSSASSSSASSSSVSAASGQSAAAYNDTFKIFQWINNTNFQATQESENLNRYDNLYDNVPVLNYIKSLCNGSMRSFSSLPDGSFTAFVPDYFGFFENATQENNTIEIPDTDLIDFSVTHNKANYKSHVFLLTNEQMQNVCGIQGANDSSLSNVLRLMDSSGIVSFQKQPAELANLIDIRSMGFSQDAQGFKDLMNRWGVSVDKETDDNIVSHVMTTIEALYMLCKSWASVSECTVQLAFRPDIYPGLRLKFPSINGLTAFVDSCTQTWDAQNGGSTTVHLVGASDAGKIGA